MKASSLSSHILSSTATRQSEMGPAVRRGCRRGVQWTSSGSSTRKHEVPCSSTLALQLPAGADGGAVVHRPGWAVPRIARVPPRPIRCGLVRRQAGRLGAARPVGVLGQTARGDCAAGDAHAVAPRRGKQLGLAGPLPVP
eukprot:CAMPEP_0172177918 /NCGR_PEP_ID=MMETSP1050-20130122/15728_1 /TAXON_ID=233186 /ORGANISM="Cryptomonas curvata, Strain CCAP979/52" /LENGTH=139 /DNA_ID=CAMNT_0012850541 /DNA_START=195 /DNA_END=615 /DNA_ORIENTATION=-